MIAMVQRIRFERISYRSLTVIGAGTGAAKKPRRPENDTCRSGTVGKKWAEGRSWIGTQESENLAPAFFPAPRAMSPARFLDIYR
jgi:hypothetical protein